MADVSYIANIRAGRFADALDLLGRIDFVAERVGTLELTVAVDDDPETEVKLGRIFRQSIDNELAQMKRERESLLSQMRQTLRKEIVS